MHTKDSINLRARNSWTRQKSLETLKTCLLEKFIFGFEKMILRRISSASRQFRGLLSAQTETGISPNGPCKCEAKRRKGYDMTETSGFIETEWDREQARIAARDKEVKRTYYNFISKVTI